MSLYLFRYLDGFVIGAAGETPDKAIIKAFEATERPFETVDQIVEHQGEELVYERGVWHKPSEHGVGFVVPEHAAMDPVTGLLDVDLADHGAVEPPNALAEPYASENSKRAVGIDSDNPEADRQVESVDDADRV